MSKHTPLVATVTEFPGKPPQHDVMEDGGDDPATVASIEAGMVGVERAREYAHLFAAAPDLLEACRAALLRIESDDVNEGIESVVADDLRAAIAKAEGGA